MTIERRARPEPGRRGPVPERGVHVGQHETQPWLDIARLNDNELVLFDRERQESWIVFPPHRLDCGAQTAIQAGLDAGWNPFK